MLTLSEQGKESNKLPLLILTLEEKKKKLADDKDKDKSKDESKTEIEDNDCKICFEKRIDIVLTPCGHVVVCDGCSKDLKNCPVCRNNVVKAVKMFKA